MMTRSRGLLQGKNTLRLGLQFRLDATDRVMVSRSTVTDKGLFASQYIPSHSLIGEYTGLVRDHDTVADYEYVLFVGSINTLGVDYVIDARHSVCKVKYINHGHSNVINCQFVELFGDHRFYVVATKPVYAGQELFIDYGKRYWSHNKPLRRSHRLAIHANIYKGHIGRRRYYY